MAEAKNKIVEETDATMEQNTAGNGNAGAQPSPEEELAIVRQELDDLRDRFMRALADVENTRKRGERDRREAEQYGGSKLARDILPVYDNLKRALDTVTKEQEQSSKALIEGVELTMRERDEQEAVQRLQHAHLRA